MKTTPTPSALFRFASHSTTLALGASLIAVSAPTAQAALQQFDVIITSDNVYELYLGDQNGQGYDAGGNLSPTGATVKDIQGAVKHGLGTDPASILNATTFSLDAPNIHWVYVAAWSDDAVRQGFLADFNNTTLGGHVFSGAPEWEVTATGIDKDGLGGSLSVDQKPTPAELTAQIMLANSGANPSGGWVKPAVYTAFNNGQGGIYNSLGAGNVVDDIDDIALWMWYAPAGVDAFAGANHSEYLIFRIPVTAVGTAVPEPATGLAGLLLGGLCLARRRRAARGTN